MKQLIAAIAFADDMQRDRRWKSADGSPYIDRSIALANEVDIERRVLLAVVQHDTIMDAETTHQELGRHFGKEVTDRVLDVTDVKSLPKGN
jgi:guanosine-3',5'-bis(diphosphate) 3'-pyrophosphohydrolase